MLNLDKTIQLTKEKGLSNTFLAKKLGRSSASLFVDWRKEKSKPSESDIVLLAELLNTTVEYLTDKSEQKNKPSTEVKDFSDDAINSLSRIEKLSPANRAKLSELIDLYLSGQDKT